MNGLVGLSWALPRWSACRGWLTNHIWRTMLVGCTLFWVVVLLTFHLF